MVRQQKVISVRTTLEASYSAQKIKKITPLVGHYVEPFEHIGVSYWGHGKEQEWCFGGVTPEV